MSLSLEDSEREMRLLREKTGRGNWDFIVKKLNRERIAPGREKRENFPPSEYWRLYAKQRGVCPGFGVPAHDLPNPPVYPAVHVDHRNPGKLKGFNAKHNLQLLCAECNGRKSSKPISQQAKETGRTYTELLGDEV